MRTELRSLGCHSPPAVCRALRSAPFDEGAPSTAVSPASDNRWFDQSLLELGEGKYLTPACLPFLSAKMGEKKEKKKRSKLKRRSQSKGTSSTGREHRTPPPGPGPHVAITSVGLPCNNRIPDGKNYKAQS